ncbi:hypothetical protein [Streptomyces sp. NPDC050738]|uniref:hypothetical protein n=1 Tax=Streptomyces sp. NPDC050738 TaxID=3154744 RepID=UPI00342E9D83
MAAEAWNNAGDVGAAVADCASGRELVGSGYADDVAVATEVDAGDVVPLIVDGAFAASR